MNSKTGESRPQSAAHKIYWIEYADELEKQLASLRSVLLITADDLEQSEGRQEWADELRERVNE